MDHRLRNFQLANSSYGCIACVRVHLEDQIICVINGAQCGEIVHLQCENKRNGSNTSLQNTSICICVLIFKFE